jgi:hypothetical protein
MKNWILCMALGTSGFMACRSADTASQAGSGGASATTVGTGGAAAAGTGGLAPPGSGGSATGGSAPGGGGASGAAGGLGGTIAVVNGTGGTPGSGGAGAGGRSPLDAGSAAGGTDGSRDGGAATDAGTSVAPLLAVLGQFTAPDVPVRGPMEAAPIVHSWPASTTVPRVPGAGLAQHPLLYAGEGYNTLFVVNGGKVVWSYATATGGEIDDVWMLSNGHILYSHLDFVEELTPTKQVVWHHAAPAGTEIHSCQPIGLDRVLFMQNGNPAMLVVMNKTTGVAEIAHPFDAGTSVHGQFRRVRRTAAGTYLLSYLSLAKVVEYDAAFAQVWTYATPSPWSAVRLKNGNTLIQIESASAAREVDPRGATVWEFTKAGLPAGIMQGNTQTSDRLANGNTVIFSNGIASNLIQAVEVTPAKQVTWILQDWANLGPATAAQLLDEPGIPENPGELQH